MKIEFGTGINEGWYIETESESIGPFRTKAEAKKEMKKMKAKRS